jgi:hypothetical protein
MNTMNIIKQAIELQSVNRAAYMENINSRHAARETLWKTLNIKAQKM